MDQKIKDILDEVGKVIRGKDEQIQMVLTAILAKGHILIEDIPGVGKTTMAVCFSRAMELTERRLQFTPDVLPSDVVGFNMLDADGEIVIRCALGLADIRHLAEHRAGRVAHVVRAQIEVRVKVDDAELRRLALVL